MYASAPQRLTGCQLCRHQHSAGADRFTIVHCHGRKLVTIEIVQIRFAVDEIPKRLRHGQETRVVRRNVLHIRNMLAQRKEYVERVAIHRDQRDALPDWETVGWSVGLNHPAPCLRRERYLNFFCWDAEIGINPGRQRRHFVRQLRPTMDEHGENGLGPCRPALGRGADKDVAWARHLCAPPIWISATPAILSQRRGQDAGTVDHVVMPSCHVRAVLAMQRVQPSGLPINIAPAHHIFHIAQPSEAPCSPFELSSNEWASQGR